MTTNQKLHEYVLSTADYARQIADDVEHDVYDIPMLLGMSLETNALAKTLKNMSGMNHTKEVREDLRTLSRQFRALSSTLLMVADVKFGSF
jgi:hypothetical protein